LQRRRPGSLTACDTTTVTRTTESVAPPPTPRELVSFSSHHCSPLNNKTPYLGIKDKIFRLRGKIWHQVSPGLQNCPH